MTGNNTETNTEPQSAPSAAGVSFINKQVLQAESSPLSGTAKPLADQAAAMMIQDMRGFLQGSEQVLMVAMARALAQITETDGVMGIPALEQCERLLEKLPRFASHIGSTAAEITKNFK